MWLAVFVGLVALGSAWALATPLASPPDEASHVARAYALVHGSLVGTVPGIPQPAAVTAVEVPAGITALQSDAACVNRAPAVPATCVNRVVGSGRLVPHLIYTGRYPPLYYALVGLPALAVRTPGVVYWMRLVSVVLSSAFLAAAVVVLRWRGAGPLGYAGVALAATPTALYLAATVNPNGLEISAALCLWVALAALVSGRGAASGAPGGVNGVGGMVAVAGISAVVVVLARGDSPLWPPVIAACLAPLASRARISALWRRRDVRWCLVAVVAAYVAAGVWILAENALAALPSGAPLRGSPLHHLRLVVDEVPRWLLEYVATFGNLTTSAPKGVYVAVAVAVVVVVGLGLARGGGRQRLSIALTVAVGAALPLALEYYQSGRYGAGAQGRYFLPLVVGIVVVPAVTVLGPGGGGGAGEPARGIHARHRWARRWVWVLGAVVAVYQAVTFAAVLHRFAVGVNGPLDPLATVAGAWVPPVPALALDTLFALAVLWVAGCLVVASRGSADSVSSRTFRCTRPASGVL